MEINNFEILIVDDPDYESIIAEIWYNNMHWAQISMEPDDVEPVIQFYPHPTKKYWEFPCDEAIKALKAAKIRLLSRRRMGNFLDYLTWKTTPPDPEQVNEEGQKLLESIVNHPEKEAIQYTHKLYGLVIEVEAPGLGGVRFTGDEEEMLGFLEPRVFINNS